MVLHLLENVNNNNAVEIKMTLLFSLIKILIYQHGYHNADCVYSKQIDVKTAARYIFPVLYFRGGNQMVEYKVK